MKTKLFSLLFIFLIGSIGIYGQIPKVIPVSPDASALAKMVNYPVSLNTGVPNISIPLYQVETGGITLPIAIDYHSGGFKINEMSTSVGLGWSLSNDLQIVRSVNGLDDFMLGQGYIGNNLMKAHSDACETCEYPLIQTSPYVNNGYYIASGAADGAPDKFNYKLLNKSGSFYFQKNTAGTGYTIVPVPYDNIKISYDSGQFIIKDTDGTTYVFGSKGGIDYSTTAARGVEITGSIWTAWKVKKIVNATETDSLKFSYQPKTTRTFVSSPESIEYYKSNNPCDISVIRHSDVIKAQNPSITTYDQLTSLYKFHTLSSPKYMMNFAGKTSKFHLPYLNAQNQVVDVVFDAQQRLNSTNTTIYSVALSKIEFRGGSVVFSGSDKLNSITVKDAAEVEIRSFNFFQSYKNAVYTADAKAANGQDFIGTMYLDSIQVKNGSNSFESYGLKYKNKFCFGGHLIGQDAWGYPNASTTEFANAGDIAVPEQKIIQDYYRACNNVYPFIEFKFGNPNDTESPDRDASQRGMLRAIIYPTGGYVNFEFESNKYSSPVDGANNDIVWMGGGLRIRAINYFDGKSSAPISQKYYRYGELEDGIGLLVNSPSRDYDNISYKFGAFSYQQTTVKLSATGIDCFRKDCLLPVFTETKTTYLPASSQNYTYSNGAPIYYTKVTEYNSDLGKYTGKKVNTFCAPGEFDTYYLSGYASKIEGTNIDRLHADGLIGAQKLLQDYKFENNKFVLEHSKEFLYTKYSRPERVKVVYAFFNNIYEIAQGNYSGTPAELYNGNASFLSGGTSIQGYDIIMGQYGIEVGKLLLTGEIDTWIKGTETLTQNTVYNYDNSQYLQPTSTITTNSKSEQLRKSFKYSYDLATQGVYAAMKAKNMISQVVEEITDNEGKEVSRTKTDYAFVDGNAGFIIPKRILKSNGGKALDTLVTFDRYDAYANIQQLSEKNALVKSYLWGYNYQYPVAEFTGIGYADATSGLNVSSLQSITDEVQLRTTLNNLRNALPDAMVKTFTFKPLVGVTSISSQAGLNSFYQYDNFGRLSVIRDHNNHIQKKVDYKMIGTANSFGNNPYYVNTPVMGTFYKICDGQTIQTRNEVALGGMFYSDNLNYLHNISYLQVNGQGAYYDQDEGCATTPDPYDYVKVQLSISYYPFMPSPNDVSIDLIQDGNIVASRRFRDNGDFTPLIMYVPKGEYTISMRQDDNFSGSVLLFYLAPSGGTITTMKTGSLINFQMGTDYVITASNMF